MKQTNGVNELVKSYDLIAELQHIVSADLFMEDLMILDAFSHTRPLLPTNVD